MNDPIAFIGQDLAFTGGQQHAADLSLWRVDNEDLEVIEEHFIFCSFIFDFHSLIIFIIKSKVSIPFVHL